MSNYFLKNGSIVTALGLEDKDLWVDNGSLKFNSDDLSSSDVETIDAKNFYVTPGLIDIHIHGGAGCNLLSCTNEDINKLKKNLIKHGVTYLLPTLITAPIDEMIASRKFLSEHMESQDPYLPQFLGINLEGPFIAKKSKGIHPAKDIKKLTFDVLEHLIDKNTRIITIAPELDPTGEFTAFLTNRNIIVSLGHSYATLEEASASINSGASLVTHLYNAMSKFHHRNPGIITTALVEDSLYIELIADNVHLHPSVIKLAIKAKPEDKVILISDSIALRDNPLMNYYIGNKKISVKDNKAVSPEGKLSGSITTVDQCVRNLVKQGIVDFFTAIKYVTYNPFKLLGIFDEYFNDNQANLVLWQKDTLKIKYTFVNGKIYEF